MSDLHSIFQFEFVNIFSYLFIVYSSLCYRFHLQFKFLNSFQLMCMFVVEAKAEVFIKAVFSVISYHIVNVNLQHLNPVSSRNFFSKTIFLSFFYYSIDSIKKVNVYHTKFKWYKYIVESTKIIFLYLFYFFLTKLKLTYFGIDWQVLSVLVIFFFPFHFLLYQFLLHQPLLFPCLLLFFVFSCLYPL